MVYIQFPPYIEEEDFDDEGEWLEKARYEIVEYILRRYGVLRSRDIARILNWKVQQVTGVLKALESYGRVKRTRLGRTQAWCPMEERFQNLMYY